MSFKARHRSTLKEQQHIDALFDKMRGCAPMFQLSENDNDSQVHARAKARNQRTFTLVEQDMTSVEVIAYWILKNIHTAPAHKLHDALETCLEMREFGAVKHAD